LHDRPAPALVASTLSAFVAAVVLPYLPFAHWLGFVPLPASLMGGLLLITVIYLACVYAAKRWFFAHYRLE